MDLRPSWLSPENFIALAGLEVKLGQTWSKHGPEMVPKNRHSIEMGLDHVDQVLKILVI